MKAIIKSEDGVGLTLGKVSKPTIGENEVLIKIKKTSICGTDLHIWKWDRWAKKNCPLPLVVGHEFFGMIEEVGPCVRFLKPGDRVTGEGHLTCSKCPGCLTGRRHLCKNVKGVGIHRNGCFAEYLALPEENVFHVPDTVSDELASIFDPYGNAVHTTLSFPVVAHDVLITGAGPIGCMAACIAKQAGAKSVTITDVNDWRLELAKKMGATHAINVAKTPLNEAIRDLKLIDGFQVGLEMSGNPQAFQSMMEAMEYGGKIALLGILPPDTPVDWDQVIFKMLELKGIYGREIFGTWLQMVKLLEGRLPLQPVITHRFPFERFKEGFEIMLQGKCGKVILDWD